MIPPTFFSKIGNDAPFLLDKGMLYQLSFDKSNRFSESQIDIAGTRFVVHPSLTLEELETIYCDTNRDAILDVQRKLIEKHVQQSQFYSKKELDSMLSSYKTAQFIINEIFPYFIDDTNLKDVLSRKSGDNKKSLLDTMIEGELVDDKQTTTEYQTIKDRIISDVLNTYAPRKRTSTEPQAPKQSNPDLAEIQDILRKAGKTVLKPTVSRYNDMIDFETILDKKMLFFIGNVYISHNNRFEFYSNVADFDKEYSTHLEKKLLLGAIDDYQDQIKSLGSVSAKKKALEKVLSKGNIEIGDVGMTTHNNRYFVYLKVPQYALKEPNDSNGSIYLFDACRVAMKVDVGDGIGFYGPYVIEKYPHPFVGSEPPAWNDICMGPYRDSGNTALEKLVNRLSAGKGVIMSGYNSRCSPRSHLSSFFNKKVSKDDLKRKNIPITNLR